ncbi:helix-turn-helix transcriptional regulator [Aliiroseovarius sp.]|uniref:helix-turn-helix transcriptional regulator n=1 Tax=Aliiroseovarius sp. TaxID=1872442 RepID=UPI003BAD890F
MPHPLHKIQPIAQAVADLFGPHVEVILHDLENDEIFAIYNNCSGQEVGMPSNLGLGDSGEVLTKDVFGPYEKSGVNGQAVNSISAVIRDDEERAVGLLCVNADYSKFLGAHQILSELITPPRMEKRPEVLFRNDWQGLIINEINHFLEKHNLAQSEMKPEQRRLLLKQIDGKGLLYARRSVDQLAAILDVSRSTLYKDLVRVRENDIVRKVLS